jgi:hypothetical protein
VDPKSVRAQEPGDQRQDLAIVIDDEHLGWWRQVAPDPLRFLHHVPVHGAIMTSPEDVLAS